MNNPYEEKVLIELKMRGFRVSSWSGGAVMVTHKFERGTISGAFGVGVRGVIYLIMIENSQKGNGQYVLAMNDIEQMVAMLKMPLYITHIWEKRFSEHLKKRGYVCTEEDDGYHMLYLKSLPDNVLRQAGAIQ